MRARSAARSSTATRSCRSPSPATGSTSPVRTACGRTVPTWPTTEATPGRASSHRTRSTCLVGRSSSTPPRPTQNIAFDVIGDPKQAGHLLAAFGWVDGADYNGWYEKTPSGSWTRFKPQGAVKDLQLGKTTFEYSRRRLDAVRPRADADPQGQRVLLLGAAGCLRVEQRLVYRPVEQDRRQQQACQLRVGAQGPGPARGPLLHAVPTGRPGLVQPVPRRRPGEPQARVPRSSRRSTSPFNGGATWRTDRARTGTSCFPCWNIAGTRDRRTRCPTTTHSDQHDIAFANVGGRADRVRQQRRRRRTAGR